MDYILRYPLNKAHYYQRQADAKENQKQYSAALEYRKIALEHLKEAVTSSSNDDVVENIHLQVIFEEKQIAKVSYLLTKSNEAANLKKTSENCKPEADLSSNNMSSPEDEASRQLEEILTNTKHIDGLVEQLSTSDKSQTQDSSSEPAVCTEGSVSASHSPLVQKPSRMDLIHLLNTYNDKNSRLVSDIRANLMLVQKEKLALSNKVKELEASLGQAHLGTKQDPNITTCSIDEEFSDLISFPVEDFAPLDCPPLDFLKNYEELSYSD